MVAIRTAYAPGPLASARRHCARGRPASEQERLLAEVEAFLVAHPRMSRRLFGVKAIGDKDLVDKLFAGWAPREATRQLVRGFIAGGTEGERLLGEIEAFLARHPRISRNQFGLLAAGNNKLVRRLEDGLNPHQSTSGHVRAFIDAYERGAAG